MLAANTMALTSSPTHALYQEWSNIIVRTSEYTQLKTDCNDDTAFTSVCKYHLSVIYLLWFSSAFSIKSTWHYQTFDYFLSASSIRTGSVDINKLPLYQVSTYGNNIAPNYRGYNNDHLITLCGMQCWGHPVQYESCLYKDITPQHKCDTNGMMEIISPSF